MACLTSTCFKQWPIVFSYRDETDEQSVQLQALLAEKSLEEVVKEVTGLSDQDLIAEIVSAVEAN